MSTHVGRGLNLSRREIALSLCVMLFGGAFCWRASEPIREQKRSATCAGNLRKISFAIQMYAADNNDTLPRAWFGKNAGPSDAQTNYKWMDAIFPYAKDEKLFVCPNDKVNPPYHFRSGKYYGSYLWNNAYYAAGDEFTPPTGRKLSQVADNFTVIIMEGDGGFQFSWPDVQTAPPPAVFDAPWHLPDVAARHSDSGGYKAPMTLWINGLEQNHPIRQNIIPKTINGHAIYTGLTIEKD